MTILRIFINNEDFTSCDWQMFSGIENTGEGVDDLSQIIQMEFEHIELYLSPHLATVFKVTLPEISDRKISDELLLGLVEERLAEEIEDCKPILMRLSDGFSYIAILNRNFYSLLLENLAEYVKHVKFIQPYSYLTDYHSGSWTISVSGKYKFVRTSRYEYFILDDQEPVSSLLESMLESYTGKEIYVYSDDNNLIDYINNNYDCVARKVTDLHYGVLTWNFYNEKSKRFNIKLDKNAKRSLVSLSKSLALLLFILFIAWIFNLVYLSYEKYKLEKSVITNTKGIVSMDKFNPNLLSQIDEKLNTTAHDKGVYGNGDYVYLFATFLKVMPDISKDMVVGNQFKGQQLQIFLNSQYSSTQFYRDSIILKNKRILATITDYKTYQDNLANANQSNNSSSGVLDDAGSSTSATAQMIDPAWVITLQTISRMEDLNEQQVSK